MRSALFLLLCLAPLACDRTRNPAADPAKLSPQNADVWSGRVVGITDGDTLKVLTTDLREAKLRLAGIDAPEKAQPYGKVARYRLGELVFGREVQVRVLTRDRYGRSVALVEAAGADVGLTLIREGLVWFYRDYQRDLPLETRQAYASAEAEAKGKGEGLWRDLNPTPPWEWRRMKRRPS